MLCLYIAYVVLVVRYDTQQRAVKAKQEWMHSEMHETAFNNLKRSEFLNLIDFEVNYHQGIRPSGEVSGTQSVVYGDKEIKPDEVLHFSLDERNNDLARTRSQNQIKQLTQDYKESSWAKAKHVIFKATEDNLSKYRPKTFLTFLKKYVKVRRLTIPMTSNEEWCRNVDAWTPFLSVLFVLYTTGLLNIYDPIQIFIISTMFSLSILIRFNTYTSEPPGAPFSDCLIIHSFIMSIVWIWVLANIVVDLISI